MKTKWFVVFASAYITLFAAGVFWYGYEYFMLHSEPFFAYSFAATGALVVGAGIWLMRTALTLEWS